MFLISSKTKQIFAAVFLCLLSVGQKKLLELTVTAPSVSLLMWHGHAVDVTQKQSCSSVSSIFKGLGCEDCCSPTHGVLRLKTEILNRLRELGLFNTKEKALEETSLQQKGVLRMGTFLTLNTTGYSNGFISRKLQ